MTIVVVKRQNKITMEGSASSINSRATAIKTILLAAWRGKLSNEEWENRIKKVLPRGVNGDVYDLADCLLKQALVGPVPNQLFISYLKHAVQCELVSHGAVLSSISNQPINLRSSSLLNRTSPIICLLEFLKSFRERILCKGTEIECLNLCHSLSELIHWLLKCIQLTIDSMINTLQQSTTNQLSGSTINASNQQTNSSQNNLQNDTTLGIIDLCTETIHYFINRPFTKSLLFISKIEYSREFDENILKTVQSIQQKLVSCPNLQFIHERIPHFKILNQLSLTFDSRELHPSVVAAQQLRCLQTHRIRSTQVTSSSNSERRIQHQLSTYVHDSTTNYALFNSLYPLVASDAVLRLARPHRHLARQIVTITNFYSAPIYMTYCELIRVCMIGLIDAGKSKLKASWPFFTFLKLPKLLIELSKLFKKQQDSALATMTDSSSTNQSSNFINDLKLSFERLCAYAPLVDEAEYKCNCDFFKCLVKELIKNDPSLMQLKNLDFRTFPARRPITTNNNDSKWGCHMMLKTEPVVTSMLETLNSEQDPTELFAILCQQCSGISFDFTLNAAAATGRLHLFVKRLVEHNELYRMPKNDLPPKHQQARALNFDITFLILIFIAQRYGPELIDKDQRTTFNRWYHECYNQETCFNCPKEMLKDCDEEIVTSLIRQLADPNSDVRLKSVNWHEICFNMPKAISEILNAWNQGSLNDDDIVVIIERIRSKMCFLAVVAATWLQCYIKTLNEVDRSKPLFLLNSFSKASPQAKQQSQMVSDSSELKSDGYSERSSLLSAIIRRMYFELMPSKSLNANGHNTANRKGSIGVVSSNNSSGDSDDSQDESVYHSYKGRFISTLSTQEIFLANAKQCLSSGWIDFDSLNSLNSLFKIIGSECFTNLIVEQILTSHESPSDLSRAVNIAFGLFHLDIEACAFALLKDTIPSWLMGEKKQTLLSQPRAFALANLTVMTIIEVFTNLKAAAQSSDTGTTTTTNLLDQDKKFVLNGIKQEPGQPQKDLSMVVDNVVSNTPSIGGSLNGPKETKRIKLLQEQLTATGNGKGLNADTLGRLEKLNDCIADLMRLFKEIMSDPVMSQRTLFPVLFLEQTVVCAREGSTMVTVHLQPEILLDIINLFSSELTFELVLAISNLSSTNSRKYAAKAMCKLAQIKESKQKQPGLHENDKPSSPIRVAANGSKTGGSTPMIIG